MKHWFDVFQFLFSVSDVIIFAHKSGYIFQNNKRRKINYINGLHYQNKAQ
jgi:hypothetical protein